MRIKALYFLFLLLPGALLGQQRFRAGLKAGISTTQVEGDTYTGFHKAGIAGGAYVTGQLNNKWSAQFEMLFIQKGSKNSHIDEQTGVYDFYEMKLNYLEVPVLFQYHQKKFTFGLGPGFGYLISAHEYNWYGEITGAVPFHKMEVSASIGVSYQLLNNLGIEWRYSNSLLPIRRVVNPSISSTYNPGQRNNVLAFTLYYTFGKKDEQQ